MPEHLVAYLDTNCFLHYRLFDQIPWDKELNAKSVCLRVAGVVVDELDKHKDKHHVKHIRERAVQVTGRLLDILDRGGAVRNHVILTCDIDLPTVISSATGIRGDDELIATVLAY